MFNFQIIVLFARGSQVAFKKRYGGVEIFCFLSF